MPVAVKPPLSIARAFGLFYSNLSIYSKVLSHITSLICQPLQSKANSNPCNVVASACATCCMWCRLLDASQPFITVARSDVSIINCSFRFRWTPCREWRTCLTFCTVRWKSARNTNMRSSPSTSKEPSMSVQLSSADRGLMTSVFLGSTHGRAPVYRGARRWRYRVMDRMLINASSMTSWSLL